MIRRSRERSEADWTPFRPGPEDLERIAGEVAAISDIQAEMVARHPDLAAGDRVAHQYQIAGGRVELRIEADLPAELKGIGLFVPGARHLGIGRLSTGLGYAHLETDPDFLGLMVAFRTAAGQRVDFLAINDPTSPTDDHRQFVKLLKATAASAGVEAPFGSGLGELDLLDLAAAQTRFSTALIRELGIKDGLKGLGHILAQTSRTLRSSTAYQTYWTGIEEVGDTGGKFVFEPILEENDLRALTPGERYLSDEWRKRQRRGDVEFRVHWLAFADPTRTPTGELTEPWQQDPRPVGQLVFPRTDPDGEEAGLWATLAAEMGANPGNWVHDPTDTVREPATEFGLARKLAYRLSQAGRGALPEQLYSEIFSTGRIGPALAEELARRRAAKARAGHVYAAPPPSS
jgi:hypothetical protein